MKTFLVCLLIASSALAANNFPKCNGANINQVWQAQDGTFWWCNGSAWAPINSASVDGGFNNLSVNNLNVAGTISGVDAGLNNVLTANLVASVGVDVTGIALFNYNNSGELAVGDGTFHNLLDCTVSNTTCTVAGTTNLSGPTNGRDAGFNCITASDAGFQNVLATSFTVGTQLVPTQHAVIQQAVECGRDAGVAGSATFPFVTAFAAAPNCVCSHVDTTNANTCTVDHTTAPTTGLAKFNVVSGGTDVIMYCCYGAK